MLIFRYEMSSPESMAHREQDFDYEVIEAGRNDEFEFMQTQVPVEEEDVTIGKVTRVIGKQRLLKIRFLKTRLALIPHHKA
jgi:hypothetical protein